MAAAGIEFITGSPLLRRAYALALVAHAGQREESDGQPYIGHPVEVARLLCDAGFDEEVVAAGLLHDTLEKSDLSSAELRRRFGDRVAGLVEAMTEPADVEPFAARKEALRAQVARAGHDAEAVMAADKIAKSSSLRRALAQFGEREVTRRVSSPLEAKLDHYHASLEQLERLAADLPLTRRLHRELDAIGRQRAHEGDLEVARAALSAINAGDAERLIAVCRPDVLWHPALTLGERGGPYVGAAGIRRYLADLEAAWEHLAIDLLDARALATRLLVLCRLDGSARRSRVRLERDAAVVIELEEGAIATAHTLLDAPE